MVEKSDPWTTVPVRVSVRLRLMKFKQPKPNRKKREHVLETLDDVCVRLMNFWDENHKGGETE